MMVWVVIGVALAATPANALWFAFEYRVIPGPTAQLVDQKDEPRRFALDTACWTLGLLIPVCIAGAGIASLVNQLPSK